MPTLRFVKAPPGKKAQAAMASAARRSSRMEETPAHAVDAAVLVLLTPAEAGSRQCLPEWNVLLIRRNAYLGVHSGQVSFPGGKREKDDAGLWETACREMFEEVGIPRERLEEIGPLTSLYVPPSNFLIHPFVAVSAPPYIREDEIRPDPREVADYRRIPLKVFNPRKAVVLDFDSPDGEKRPAPAWRYADYTVWGATAMILSELYHSVREAALVMP